MRTCLVLGLALTVASSAVAADDATHEQVKVISVKRNENGGSLQTIAATPKGTVVALVSQGRTATAPSGSTSPLSQVLLFDDQGSELGRWPVDFLAQSVGIGPDGAIYVAGDGQLAKFAEDGKQLAKSEVTHLAAVLKDEEKLRQQAEATLKVQKESIENAKKSFTDQLKTLQDKREENLTAAEKQQIKSLEINIKAYDQYLSSQQTTIEQAMKSLTTRLRTINSIAVTDNEVFIACGELKGYGYAVWRMDHDFANPKQVLEKLGGCCGQMDVQAGGGHLFVAENTKHRVGQYDTRGKLVQTFGKRHRESEGECFGGCCNPMNCRVTTSGDIYTAESEGIVKKFNADGEFVALIGTVKLTGGCKNVAVAASPSGDKVYFCDLPGSRIIVLGKKAAPVVSGGE